MSRVCKVTTGPLLCFFIGVVFFPGGSYQDVPALVDPADVGMPSVFVSHAWMGLFVNLVAGLEAYFAAAVAAEVFVWLGARAQ